MPETRDELIKRLEGQANKIRRNIWRALKAGGTGHAGGSLSATDMLSALYFYKMNVRPAEPDWADRDRFILSKGHANAGLGATLELAGIVDEGYCDRFYMMDDGRPPFGMHPDIKVPGIEMSTGGLGHGLSIGVGMALGARIKGQAFHTFVMIGDGELHEGSNWEAAMAGAKYRLTNLTALIDFNKISQSAHVAEVMGLEPLADKWRSFGWEVREIDGHNMTEIVDTLDALPFSGNKPNCVIMHTIKGKGASFAEDTHLWHQNAVNQEIYDKAIAELETV
ncbi:MAG: transketolase [Chloroflexi bacterium]|nr:transketolase [Chloroflexota bacterium]